MNHMGTSSIQTERLLLRRLVFNDAQALFALEKIGKTLDEAKEILCNMMADYPNMSYYHWGIEYEGVIVGRIKAHNISDTNENMELGYSMAGDYRNKGIMTEAISAVIKHLLQEVMANRVYVMIRTNNIASNRVAQKAGMILDGCLREHFRDGDAYADVNVYSTIRKDLM